MLLVYYICISISLALFRKKSLASSLPLAIMFHAIVVIIAGIIFGDLRIGLFGGLLIYIGILIASFIRDGKGAFFRHLLIIITAPDIYILIFIFMILSFVNDGRLFVYFDEYSHWGPMIKEMFRLDDFYFTSEHYFAHKSYVPLITVIEYISLKMNVGGYVESTVYQGLQIYMISLIMPLLDFAKVNGNHIVIFYFKVLDFLKQFILSIVILISGIAVTYIPADYTMSMDVTIYTDLAFGLTIGFFFSYFLFIIINNEKIYNNAIEMVIVLTSVICIKMIGILMFPLLLGTVFLFAYVNAVNSIEGISDEKTAISKAKYVFAEDNKKIVGNAFMYIVLPLAIWFGYKLRASKYVESAGGQNYDGALSKLLALLTHGYTEDYQSIVSVNFFRAMFEREVIGENIAFVQAFIFIIGAMGIIYALMKMTAKNTMNKYMAGIKAMMFTVIFGAVYFVVWMWILYLISFSEGEALTLASFDRYLGSYLESILLFEIYLVLGMWHINRKLLQNDYSDTEQDNQSDATKQKIFEKGLAIIAVTAIISIVCNEYTWGRFDNINTYLLNGNYHFILKHLDAANAIASNVPIEENSDIYIFDQNGNGGVYARWNYYLMYMFEDIDWGSIKADDVTDVYSSQMSVWELSELLTDYEYVLTSNIDDQFVSDYSSLFEDDIQNMALYKQEYIDGKIMYKYILSVDY